MSLADLLLEAAAQLGAVLLVALLAWLAYLVAGALGTGLFLLLWGLSLCVWLGAPYRTS